MRKIKFKDFAERIKKLGFKTMKISSHGLFWIHWRYGCLDYEIFFYIKYNEASITKRVVFRNDKIIAKSQTLDLEVIL